MSDKILPFTLQSALPDGFGEIEVAIGKNFHQPKGPGTHWFTVFDRTNIQADPVFEESQNSATSVPEGIKPFIDNKYLLCLATNGMRLNGIPQGALFDFLISQGAGKALRTLEQILLHIGSGEITGASYCMTTVLGSKGEAFESYNLRQQIYIPDSTDTGFTTRGAILPISLRSTDIGGTIHWAPVDFDD